MTRIGGFERDAVTGALLLSGGPNLIGSASDVALRTNAVLNTDADITNMSVAFTLDRDQTVIGIWYAQVANDTATGVTVLRYTDGANVIKQQNVMGGPAAAIYNGTGFCIETLVAGTYTRKLRFTPSTAGTSTVNGAASTTRMFLLGF